MILSIHIPKTAGTSFRRILELTFGRSLLLQYWELTDVDGRACSRIPDGTRCIHGHFVPDALLPQFPDATLLTWVRDPVERITSCYAHVLRHPDPRHPVHREVHEKKLTLLQFATLPSMRNEIAHYLGHRQPASYAFIGITEHFDESLQRFFGRFRLRPVGAPRENGNPDFAGAGREIEPALRRKIAALNERDMDLYAECCRVFSEREQLVA